MQTKRRSHCSASAAALIALFLSACGTEQGEALAIMPAERGSQALALDGSPVDESTSDILAYLQSIEGMTVEERPSRVPGTRFFVLAFEQPVDHTQPNERRFQQRLTLLHRSASAPLVLNLSGYGISAVPRAGQTELTALLAANQLTVEHRFFGPSTPQPKTWEHLTLKQSAGDHHRIVQALKPFYSGRWLSTGASKGGMTAVFHRYFYPDDVDVTVPYVAPNTFGEADPRYILFVESRGSPECREQLHAFQRTVLQRRDSLASYLASTGATFDAIGADRAIEFGVLELPFFFWQYFDASLCGSIPGVDASNDEVWMFFNLISSPAFNYGDPLLDFYAGYYYQAATELGAPRYRESHLHGLLRYPRQDVPATFPPLGVTKRFDMTAMLRVFHWVYQHGERMLFIYGENDPWSTGAFEVRSCNDSYRYFIPSGNHDSGIFEMAQDMKAEVLERIFTWMEVPAPAPSLRAAALQEDETVGWDSPALEQRFRL
ncbi:MAG: hypothetical protein JXB05_28320 [Myxococcaceae bacterium]|nr:hypothetical protein [Myxococcaceae bacterium]